MHDYTVTVATGDQQFSGTDAEVFLTLVGKRRSSEKTKLDKIFSNDFAKGAVDSYDIEVPEDLGKIVFVKLEMKKGLMKDDWYCKYIKVMPPSGESLEFPCYRWVTHNTEMVLRDGRARLPQDDKSAMEREHRREELESRRMLYRWTEWQPGFPMSIDTKTYKQLPLDVKFDFQKEFDFDISYINAIGNLKLNDFVDHFQSAWDSIDYFKKIYISVCGGPDYVLQHWQEDLMFGYQFLNGCNPVMIRKCPVLPAKFPVTHEMVEFCLERGLTLEEEVKAGNIYIADFELLENIVPNATDPSTRQYLAAPICLLYRNTKNKILPIAIQLDQNPGDESPIFFPNDAEFDWMLAKIWVRYSDYNIHQNITHLMCTHLISEAFAVAMFRQLAAVHPVYKLLIPHVRFTIAINTKAREELIGKNGVFDKANGIGGGGHIVLLQRGMKTFTYRSLIFPEAIKARGMDNQEELPTYFYRDDGYKVWEAIGSFVEDVVHIYYRSDEMVQEDKEIQAFAEDVCVFGMHDSCGFPKSLKNREQLTEYLTAIIFNTSAQHAAVNFNQFNWYSWIPNCPSTMRQPPPTKKGTATMESITASLPDRARSCWHIGAAWALSQFQDNEIFLGMYPDEHFIEKPVKEAMEKYRKKLVEVSRFIKARNEGMELPYNYLSPDRIPNSVAV